MKETNVKPDAWETVRRIRNVMDRALFMNRDHLSLAIMTVLDSTDVACLGVQRPEDRTSEAIPAQENERDMWLLTPLGSIGRTEIPVAQYEELRVLAVKLAKRFDDVRRVLGDLGAKPCVADNCTDANAGEYALCPTHLGTLIDALKASPASADATTQADSDPPWDGKSGYGHVGEVLVESCTGDRVGEEARHGWAVFSGSDGECPDFRAFFFDEEDARAYAEGRSAKIDPDEEDEDLVFDPCVVPAAIENGRVIAANHFDDEKGRNALRCVIANAPRRERAIPDTTLPVRIWVDLIRADAFEEAAKVAEKDADKDEWSPRDIAKAIRALPSSCSAPGRGKSQ